MTDLDKAREWADRTVNQEVSDGVRAAVNTIHSLPDQFIDAEKVKELIDIYTHARDANGKGTEGWMMNHLVVSNLESLLPVPSLPTLADMTQEERAACQWMQCEIDGQIAGILARVDKQRGHIWIDSGYSLGWKLENITPLPDLPKLKWPGNEAVEPPALPDGMRLADHETYGRVVVSPKDDLGGDYRVFCSQDQTKYGDNWWYAHKSELTFLDGEA